MYKDKLIPILQRPRAQLLTQRHGLRGWAPWPAIYERFYAQFVTYTTGSEYRKTDRLNIKRLLSSQ